MNKRIGAGLLCLALLTALAAGCAPEETSSSDPTPGTATEPTTTTTTAAQEVNPMDKLERYEITADKLDTSKWKFNWSSYMFPQTDGSLQFGMGLGEMYCLGAYGAPEDMLNKVVALDMSFILRPALSILLRAPMNSGLGKGNPCYTAYFYDDGVSVSVGFSRYDPDGTEQKLGQPVALGDLIDVWDYNRYEIALLNEGDDVHLMMSVNGKLIIDYTDKAPGKTYQQAGHFIFQGGYSVVRLRGTDSDVPSALAKPEKTGEVNGVAMYDVSAVDSVDTRLMTTIMTAREFTDSSGYTVKYRIYLPAHYDAGKKYPLQLHLHGGGLRGSDNTTQLTGDFTQLNMMVQQEKKEEFIFIVPECPEDRFFGDSMTYNYQEMRPYLTITDDNESEMIKAMVELVDSLTAEFSVDDKRLYLSGASMGGIGAYDIMARYPGKFAAALIGCAASDVSKNVVERIAQTPLYICHGSEDTAVPVQCSRDMAAALEALGTADFVYKEFAGRGHDFTTAQDLADAIEWMFARHR